jgi:hypothetical protein
VNSVAFVERDSFGMRLTSEEESFRGRAIQTQLDQQNEWIAVNDESAFWGDRIHPIYPEWIGFSPAESIVGAQRLNPAHGLHGPNLLIL